MARIDDLRPDQRATLQLLLQQGRSYDDISNLLRMESDAVRERAHSALDALGPEEVPGLSLELQDEIADYLLGQQTASQRAGTRDFLQTSPAGRAWARAVSSELRPLAGDNLPDIPAEAAEVDEAFDALDARTQRREKVERSSRVGGIILIAAAVLGLFLIVALGISVLGGDDDDGGGGGNGGGGETTTSAQTQPAAGPTIIAQINLQPPEGAGNDRRGVAQIAEQEGTRGIALVAEGFQPARENPPRFYAIWITGENESRRLGFPPQPDKEGRLATSFPYPDDAEKFDTLVITQETQDSPKQPGRVLLQGPLEGTPVAEGTQTAPPATTPAP